MRFKSAVLLVFFVFLAFTTSRVFAQELEGLLFKHDLIELQSITKTASSISFFKDPTQPIYYKIPILMYHYVEPVSDPRNKVRTALNTLPLTLEEQILTLKKANYTFLTNEQISDILDGKKDLPKNPIALTFDDGYRDFYEWAYPILKRENARATNYVISGLLNNPNHLTTTQLIELSLDPNIEIAAHTVDHLWLKNQGPDIDHYEITTSKAQIEDIIGKSVTSFAYPYGAFDEQAINTVKESGYRSAVSTLPGIMQSGENRFIMYRLRPGTRVGNELLNWLSELR